MKSKAFQIFRLITALLLFCSISQVVKGQAPSLAWAKNFEGSNSDEGRSIITDPAGNVYVVGYFDGTIDLDPGAGVTSFTSIGGNDMYVTKFDINGNFVWARQIGGLDSETPMGVALDGAGNLYISGQFQGTPDFDPGASVATLTAIDFDVFMLKLNSSGNFVWVRQLATATVNGMTVDGTSNVYATGSYASTIDFDPGSSSFDLTPLGQSDIYIWKLTSNGDFIWAKSLGGVDYEEAYSISTDASQNVFITGYFTTTVDFDPGTGSFDLTPSGPYDAFILKLDAAGTFGWAKNLGGTGAYTFGSFVRTDPAGNVYITGNYEGTTDFDPGAGLYPLTSDLADVFVAKLANNGNFIYAKSFGGSGYDYATGLAADATQNVYTTGYFEGLADFDPGSPTFPLTSEGSSDIFISKLDQNGALVWAGQIGGTSNEYSYSISVDGSGNIYTTGSFDGVADFDLGPCSYNLSSGSNATFIQKILPTASGSTCLVITLQPVSTTACPGQTVTFTTAATGTTNIEYQWQIFNAGTSVYDNISNGGGYSGATTPTLSINTTGPFGNGDYRCKISGDLVSDVYTNMANLSVSGIGAPSTAGGSRCGPGIVSLSASGAINGQYRWYDVATGGTAVAGEVNSTYATPAISSTTTYYVSINNGTCEGPRASVVATIITTVSPPVTTGATGCGGGSYLLSASGTTNGNYRWYASATGGTAITGAVNNSYTTPPISSTTTYFVSIVNAGCESSRTPVEATINICPQAPGLAWAGGIGGASYETGNSITVDASGNTYVTGYFWGPTDFDPGPGSFILSTSASTIFVTKLNPSGGLVWAKALGGGTPDRGNSIALDPSGNVLITGYFSGTGDFDPGGGVFNMSSAGLQDIFIEKLDPNGNFIWARRMGGTSTDRGYGITTDAAGNVYSTGYFLSTVDFDPGPGTFNLTAPGSFHQVFVSKLSPSGNYIWAGMMGGTASDWGNAIALDPAGNILVTGLFGDTSDFDPGPGTFNLFYAGGFDAFVLKLDGDGVFIWAKRFGSNPSQDEGFSIASDASHNVYTTGTFKNTVDFDPGAGTFNLTSDGREDIYVSKLDANGNFMWAKRMGGTSFDFSNSMAVDGSGNVFTTGWFDGAADFDPGNGAYNITSSGDYDMFISKLDTNGDFVWAARMGGSNSQDRAYALAVDNAGNIFTTGYFWDTADFDPGVCVSNLTAAGTFDAVVFKLSPSVASLCVSVEPIPSSVCLGSIGTFTVNAIGTSGITYQWQKLNSTTSLFENISDTGGYTGTNIATLSVNTTGNFGAGDYRCKVSGNLATDKFSTSAALTINSPAAPATVGASGCSSSSLILTASGAVNGQYRWYTVPTGGTIIPGEVNSTYTTTALSANSTYYVSVNNGTCESTRTPVVATINAIPTKPSILSSITPSGGNVSVCSSNVLTLTAPAGFSSYLWSTGASTQQIIASASGSYSVVVKNVSGCASIASDGLNVTVIPAPCGNQAPVITATSVTTQVEGKVSLNLTSLISDPDNNLDILSLKIIVPPSSGAKALIAVGGILELDYQGISFSGTDKLTIGVCDLFGDCTQQEITIEVVGDIFVFNGISPNQDGQNDFWLIQNIDALEDTKNNKVVVYNRWGDAVFEADNYDNKKQVFTGLNKNGNELPAGTYFYKIEFASGKPTQTGYLSLKR